MPVIEQSDRLQYGPVYLCNDRLKDTRRYLEAFPSLQLKDVEGGVGEVRMCGSRSL